MRRAHHRVAGGRAGAGAEGGHGGKPGARCPTLHHRSKGCCVATRCQQLHARLGTPLLSTDLPAAGKEANDTPCHASARGQTLRPYHLACLPPTASTNQPTTAAGKEANVYHASAGPSGGCEMAIKVYKTAILVFRDRDR